MAKHSMRLPSRKPAKALLAKLDHKDHGEFQSDLLDALWDAHEADELPQPIVELLCDWVAHAHFEDSPVVQQRVAEVRGKTASV